MVLLISETNDITTNEVVAWLNAYGVTYQRMNNDEYARLHHIALSNTQCKIQVAGIDPSHLKKVWHRRGSLRFLPHPLRNVTNLYPYLKKEEDSVLKSIEDILRGQHDYVGSYHKEIENYKIDHLIKAKQAGLRIPDTLITTSKKELIRFFNHHKAIITKDIRYGIKLHLEDRKLFSSGTFVVTQEMIDTMDTDFGPTLIQEKIEKEYEIRIFFFKNRLYPMAILSQNDTKTAVDYRNYNREKPNRNIPVLLPGGIKEKVLRFIELSELSTGSIDIIVSEKGEYVFLEVNPQGQLDWVSKNCNYYIEKDIAEYLIAN